MRNRFLCSGNLVLKESKLFFSGASHRASDSAESLDEKLLHLE